MSSEVESFGHWSLFLQLPQVVLPPIGLCNPSITFFISSLLNFFMIFKFLYCKNAFGQALLHFISIIHVFALRKIYQTGVKNVTGKKREQNNKPGIPYIMQFC
jgi:hypothetical protein